MPRGRRHDCRCLTCNARTPEGLDTDMRRVRAQNRAVENSLHLPASMTNASTLMWRDAVSRYARPDTKRAVVQVLNTGLPFLLLMGAMFYALSHNFWPAVMLALPAGALLVRLFAIQHDCGHGSFFKSRLANNALGWLIGIVTLTPYDCWRRSHATHHATSGNLDRRGIGDVDTLTVREYQSSSQVAPPGLSPVPASAHHVRRRTGLSVPDPPPHPGGHAPQPLHLPQRRRHQRRGRDHDRGTGDRRRAGAVPCRLSAGPSAGCFDRRMALLHPASVRGHLLAVAAGNGISRRRRWRVVPSTTCRAPCTGSPAISACTTSTTSPARSRTITCATASSRSRPSARPGA